MDHKAYLRKIARKGGKASAKTEKPKDYYANLGRLSGESRRKNKLQVVG